MTAETSTTTTPTQDERIMAAVSHVSIVLTFWGMIVSILIWVLQKDKSPYVRFQALQAGAYHLLTVLGWILVGGCYMFATFGMMAFMPFMLDSMPRSGPGAEFFIPFAIPFGVMGCGMLLWFAAIVYGLAGAVMTLQGKDFRYLVLGARLERFLEQK